MSVELASETEEAITRHDTVTVDEVTTDPGELLDHLSQATSRIRLFFALFFAAGGFWLGLKCLAIFNSELRTNFPFRFSLLGLLVAFQVAIAIAYWRLSIGRRQEEQEKALRDMLELSEREPLHLESAMPHLKRLSHWWSPTSKDNHLIARQIVARIEVARGCAQNLPLAFEAAEDRGSELPRSV